MRNYGFVLLLLCVQHGSLISAPFGARRGLLLASGAEGGCLVVKGFVCLLRLSGKALGVPELFLGSLRKLS